MRCLRARRPSAALRRGARSRTPPRPEHDEVADVRHGSPRSRPTQRFLPPRGQQEREVVVDAAVAVGQIGMTHPACLDPHDHVVRVRSGMLISASSTGAPCCGRRRPGPVVACEDLAIRAVDRRRDQIEQSTATDISTCGLGGQGPPHLDAGCVLEYILPYSDVSDRTSDISDQDRMSRQIIDPLLESFT